MSPDVIDRWWSPNDEAASSAGIGSSHVTRSGLPLAAHRDVIRSTHLQRSAPSPPSVIIYTIPASRRVTIRMALDHRRACRRPQPLKGRRNATRLPAETLDLCCRASSGCRCSTYVTRLTTKPLHADRAHMHTSSDHPSSDGFGRRSIPPAKLLRISSSRSSGCASGCVVERSA